MVQSFFRSLSLHLSSGNTSFYRSQPVRGAMGSVRSCQGHLFRQSPCEKVSDLRQMDSFATIRVSGKAPDDEGDKRMSDEKQGSGFGWFLIGLGIGAAVGVLYAPKAGYETREDLRQGARESGEYLRQKSRAAADQVNNLIDVGRDQVGDYVDKAKAAVDRGRSQWETYVDRGRQVVSDQASKVSAAVEAGKQAYKSSTTTGEGSNA
jgi:gas vesicle protein